MDKSLDDEMELKPETFAAELLVLSDRFQVPDLVALCEYELVSQVDEHNALESHRLAERFNLRCLKVHLASCFGARR